MLLFKSTELEGEMLGLLGSGAGDGILGGGNPLLGAVLIVALVAGIIFGARWLDRFIK